MPNEKECDDCLVVEDSPNTLIVQLCPLHAAAAEMLAVLKILAVGCVCAHNPTPTKNWKCAPCKGRAAIAKASK